MAGAQNGGLTVAERRALRERERADRSGRGNPATGSGGPEVPSAGGLAGTPELPLADVAYNPANRREELTDLTGLADTFRRLGVLQSLLVIPVDVFTAAFPEHAAAVSHARVVAIGGNRRLKAAHMAQLATVPVNVNPRLVARKDIIIAAATENVQREPLKPLEELDTIEELKAELDTYEVVAQELGKSAGWISQRRRLANLQPETREALRSGVPGMTIEVARELGKITDRDAQLASWKDYQEKAQQKAEQPRRRGRAAAPRKTEPPSAPIPAQTTGPDEEAEARRAGCVRALQAADIDPTAVVLLALGQPSEPQSARNLADELLAAAGHAGGTQGDIDEKRQMLALALAHCEFGNARAAYADWLTTAGFLAGATSAASAA